MSALKQIEKSFEFILWNFRLFTLIPVIFGLLSTVNFFVLGTFEICNGIRHNFHVGSKLESQEIALIVSYIIGGIDYYLIGVILLIFSFGIYELFISKVDIRFEKDENNVLAITSLEELKKKILQVIIVALIVSLFKKMISLEVETAIDTVYVSVSILLVSLSSYLMHNKSHHD